VGVGQDAFAVVQAADPVLDEGFDTKLK